MENINRSLIAAVGSGFTSRSASITRKIHKLKGLKRHALRLKQKRLGNEIRHFNLARAFLLGRSYFVLEVRCHVPPNSWQIAHFVKFLQQSSLTLESVQKRIETWLQTSLPQLKGEQK